MLYVQEKTRRRKAIELECTCCNKKFLRAKVYVKADQKNHYCCVKCKDECQKKRIKMKCAFCGKDIEVLPSRVKKCTYGKHFCSRKCKDEAQRLENGVIPVYQNLSANGKFSYRARAFRSFKNECFHCGYDDYIEVLEVHHIDKDRSNNVVDNLRISCPTCHKLEHLGLI